MCAPKLLKVSADDQLSCSVFLNKHCPLCKTQTSFHHPGKTRVDLFFPDPSFVFCLLSFRDQNLAIMLFIWANKLLPGGKVMGCKMNLCLLELMGKKCSFSVVLDQRWAINVPTGPHEEWGRLQTDRPAGSAYLCQIQHFIISYKFVGGFFLAAAAEIANVL